MDDFENVGSHIKVFVELLSKFFNQKEILHAIAILIRAYDEICYMYKHFQKVKDFSISQMERFSIDYNSGVIMLYVDNILVATFTHNEIHSVINDFYAIINNRYSYDFRNIDPIFFSLFFFDVLNKIQDIRLSYINISQFRLLRKNSAPVLLEDSEPWKALITNNYEHIFTPFPSNHLIDSDKERLNRCLNSIKENGYPFQNQYIILYNDEPYIRDGQHRACSIKYLWGDIDVPVLRFYLKNNYFYD